ncbi:MAG TPA: thioesterase family protein [Egicoccus sp.]|nr:thioesterase family protein [Egicoccus sp.]HSK22189.1 thioesterase family protein [Egicoccus sp.]
MTPLRDLPVPDRDAFAYHRPMPTRWHDNDHYGHVNNVVYYAWFDTTVNAYLIERSGVDVRELDAVGLVVETGCRYLRPLSFPQHLEIGLAVERLGSSSVTYRLAVFDDDDDAAAVGRFTHVYVDRSGAAVPVPDLVRRTVTPLLRR